MTKIRFIPGGNIPNLQVGNKNIMVIGPSGEVEKTKSKSKKSKENVKLTGKQERSRGKVYGGHISHQGPRL